VTPHLNQAERKCIYLSLIFPTPVSRLAHDKTLGRNICNN